MIKFTEEKLEQAIIELLDKEEYLHVHGGTLQRASGDVLIREDLREYLSYRYAADGITEGEIDHIFRRLDAFSSADLYESNKAIMKMVSDGFLLKREDRSQKDLYVELIDYRGIAEQRRPKPGEVITVAEDASPFNAPCNIFKAVNQLEIVGAEKRIPDCIVYINGLPLVVFEFKSAIREEATIHDAYVQLTTRYRRDIPDLFKYNTFCVISDGVNSKLGSFFAPYEFFYAWRRAERNPHPQPLSQMERGGHYRGGFDFSGLVEKARKLRQKQTSAEVVMWELLRNSKLEGLKFHRQHQIGEYIVDFYCHEKKLIVELDGEVHNETAQIEKDKKRTAYFETMGFHVLRFENRHFLTDADDVLNTDFHTH